MSTISSDRNYFEIGEQHPDSGIFKAALMLGGDARQFPGRTSKLAKRTRININSQPWNSGESTGWSKSKHVVGAATCTGQGRFFYLSC